MSVKCELFFFILDARGDLHTTDTRTSCRQMRWSSMATNHCCEQYRCTGETLAAKSHNQIMQNVTRKILYYNQYAENNDNKESTIC